MFHENNDGDDDNDYRDYDYGDDDDDDDNDDVFATKIPIRGDQVSSICRV